MGKDAKTPEEAAYRVDESSLLYLKKAAGGYHYEFYDAGNHAKLADGEIPGDAVSAHPAKNPLTAARSLAIAEFGTGGGRVERIGLSMLEGCRESGIRRRSLFEPETLPKNDIRFIDSSYREQFRIPDGGTVMVDYPDRHFSAKCEYLDSYHTRINGDVFHICEFAEILERGGATCRPEPEVLSDRAAWQLGSRAFLAIKATGDGYQYTLAGRDFRPDCVDFLRKPELSMLEARDAIMEQHGMSCRSRTMLGYDFVMEEAGRAASAGRDTGRKSVLGKLETGKTKSAARPKAAAAKKHEEVL